jgi:hypothetical protein
MSNSTSSVESIKIGSNKDGLVYQILNDITTIPDLKESKGKDKEKDSPSKSTSSTSLGSTLVQTSLTNSAPIVAEEKHRLERIQPIRKVQIPQQAPNIAAKAEESKLSTPISSKVKSKQSILSKPDLIPGILFTHDFSLPL